MCSDRERGTRLLELFKARGTGLQHQFSKLDRLSMPRRWKTGFRKGQRWHRQRRRKELGLFLGLLAQMRDHF